MSSALNRKVESSARHAPLAKAAQLIAVSSCHERHGAAGTTGEEYDDDDDDVDMARADDMARGGSRYP